MAQTNNNQLELAINNADSGPKALSMRQIWLKIQPLVRAGTKRKDIARQLNEMHYRGPRGAKLSTSHISKAILTHGGERFRLKRAWSKQSKKRGSAASISSAISVANPASVSSGLSEKELLERILASTIDNATKLRLVAILLS